MSHIEKRIFSLLQPVLTEEALEKGRLTCSIDHEQLHSLSLSHDLFQKPNVLCTMPKRCPGILVVQILVPLAQQISESEISEVVRSWKLKRRQDSVFSFSIFPIEIRIQDKPQTLIRTYSCQFVEAKYYIEDLQTFEALQIESLENDLKALVSQTATILTLVATKDLSTDGKILELRHELITEAREFLKRSSNDLLEELQRFLLATEKEFLRLRSLEHITKIVRTHFWLRKNTVTPKKAGAAQSTLRHILIRAFSSLIKYPFGEREVVSLVIFVSYLDDYERLKSSHIIEAIQDIFPEAAIVPESFYSYWYPHDKACSLYLEIEKKDAQVFSGEEIQKIKDTLNESLHKAIEPVVSRIDIPINEEEHLRNILLLSQELKGRRDKPQVVLQFIKQHTMTLEFSVTLMKVGNEGDIIDIEKIAWPQASEYLHIIPTSSSTVGYIRGKYPKQVISCSVHCAKKPFSRPNKTIDYIRSREYIITSLEHIFGPLRDVNGGLIGKQKKFLSEVKGKLSSEEIHESELVESLFLNMSSSIVRSLLSPDSILSLYRTIKKKLPLKNGVHLFFPSSENGPDYHLDSFPDDELANFFCVILLSPQKISEKNLIKKISEYHLNDHDLAISHFFLPEGQILYALLMRKNKIQDSLNEVISYIESVVLESQENMAEKKSIRISLPRPTLLLDPRVGTDRTSGIVIKLLYEGLMRLDPNGKPKAALAEKITITKDRKRYVFSLRKSVWSNGRPVTAYDFEYAWKKILDPSFKTLFDYLFHPIKNARAVKAGLKPLEELGVTAQGPYELIVDLEIPAPYFLELLCHWIYSPLSKEVDLMHPGWAYYVEDTYVSNGPYRLTKWRRESEIQAIKNEHYWDADAVHLDRIDISIIEDPKTAMQLYSQGQLDWIGEPLTEIPINVLRSRPKTLQSHPISSVQWFAFNVQHKPFQSKKVRQAFHLALNKKAIISAALFGDEIPAHSILPQGLTTLSPPYEEWNLDKAKALFSEGLQELSLTRDEIPPLILKVYDQEPIKTVAKAVSMQWQEAFDIPIRIEVLSWHRYFESIPELNYDIISIMWYLWFFDPMYTLETLSSLSNGMNLSQWQHPEFISLYRQAQKETCEDRRRHFLFELEKIVMDELPIAPVFEYTLRYMKNSRLSNIYLSHLGNIDFKWADLT